MDEQEKYDILKKEVDSIQIQLSQEKKPFYQNPSIIISMVALLFSFGTTAVSYYKGQQEDVRANRREARELIQRITKLPIENFELMKRNKGSALGESLSRMINQENVILASQASELIKRYPESFSSNEYFSVASALLQSNIKDDIPYLLDNAIRKARNYTDYNYSNRTLAMYHFAQGNASEGRKLFKMALAVWDKFPEKNSFVVHSTDVDTLMFWSNAELSINNYSEATNLIERAKDSLKKLPPSAITTSLALQIEDVEKRIEKSN